MICKVLTQDGYTNRLIYTRFTIRLASACRTRNFQLHAFSTKYLVLELVEHPKRVNLRFALEMSRFASWL